MSAPATLQQKSLRALAGREGFIPMEPEDEQALGRRARGGDAEAAWTLVMANQNFVRSVARRYRRDGVDIEDLVAEGLLGLLEAAERFDPERGIKFITYGIWWVKRAILRYLRCVEHAVHVPKYKQHELQELGRKRRELSAELGREPNLEELAEASGTSVRELSALQALAASAESLDADPDKTARHVVSEDADAESQAILLNSCDRLHEVLAVLDDRERLIVRHRFGLDGTPTRTLASIGDELGLTKERIRQLERLACEKLRDAMQSAPPRKRAA